MLCDEQTRGGQVEVVIDVDLADRGYDDTLGARLMEDAKTV